MKQRLVLALSVLLMLVVGTRLVVLIRGELNRLERAARFAASIPKAGSLHGVGPNGAMGAAAPGFGYRLLFVVHSSKLDAELEYWNAVRIAVGPKASGIDWWGICDSGSACDTFQSAARFSIVGFLDPYQMRVLANADVSARVLLYESASLRAAVERTPAPAEMAEAIARALQ